MDRSSLTPWFRVEYEETVKKLKEKIMTNTEFYKGYKQGVLDATAPEEFYKDAEGACYLYGSPLGGLLNGIRKKLLTKKVTKWIGLFHYGDNEVRVRSLRGGDGDSRRRLFDAEGEAKAEMATFSHPVGVVPIEIEINL